MKISERMRELFSERPRVVFSEAIVIALDEWQASVEERLASIGLGAVSGVYTETVLARGFTPPARFDEEKLPAVPIFFDPGPSKHDGEPREPKT